MTTERVRRIGLVQIRMEEDPAANVARAESAIREAARGGAEIICLPELFRTRYFPQAENAARFDLAEPIPGPTTERMAKIAVELGVALVVPLFERRAAGLYHNSAVILDADGSIVGRYRKMHVPDDPGFYEKFYFAPGDQDDSRKQGFQPIDTSVGRLGLLVCWDQWYPEAARLMALAGAEVLLYPTAIGWSPSDDDGEKARQKEAWTLIQRSHAVANGLPVVVANRVGHEPDHSGVGEGIDFWGGSFVAGPQGELLAHAGTEAERMLVTLDMSRGEDVRRIWPYLRDRRIDAYGDLTRRYRD